MHNLLVNKLGQRLGERGLCAPAQAGEDHAYSGRVRFWIVHGYYTDLWEGRLEACAASAVDARLHDSVADHMCCKLVSVATPWAESARSRC